MDAKRPLALDERFLRQALLQGARLAGFATMSLPVGRGKQSTVAAASTHRIPRR